MDLAEKIQSGIHRLPKPLAQEVLNLIGYLEFRHGLKESEIIGAGLRNTAAAVQSIAAFRGSGKGGGTAHLLADRQVDREQEA